MTGAALRSFWAQSLGTVPPSEVLTLWSEFGEAVVRVIFRAAKSRERYGMTTWETEQLSRGMEGLERMSARAGFLKFLWLMLIPVPLPDDKVFCALAQKFDIELLEEACNEVAQEARCLPTCALDPRPSSMETGTALRHIQTRARKYSKAMTEA